MIRSLIDMLRDCLPIHAGWSQAQDDSQSPGELCPPTSALQRYIKAQAPGTAMSFPSPPVPKTGVRTYNVTEVVTQFWSLREAQLTAPLWGLAVQPPTTVTDVKCRAREDGYRLHGVLERITFGLNGEPKVKVTVKATGQELELPLDAAHLFTQFMVKGGYVPKDRSKMWPLEAIHDAGFVLVFIYEPDVDGAGQVALPLAPFKPSGAGQWVPARFSEKRYLAGLAPPGGDPDAWLEAMTCKFMNVGANPQISGKINETKDAPLVRPRIVVALSVGTLCERADFEPGGIVGMAKLVPNIMVASGIALATLEGTVKIERTASTTVLDQGDGSARGTCCGALPQIGALLVADDNAGGKPQKPFWGGTFSYVETDADKRLGGQRLHVVDRSKRTSRSYAGGKRLQVARSPQTLLGLAPTTVTGIDKVPGQGEFDNLHLAPTLKLDLAKVVVPVYAGEAYVPPLEYTVDPATAHTDRVWMAPFCSHDCFHTHWRWGAGEDAKWTMGWDKTGPHMVAGAPMIPVYQDAWLELHGPSSYSYHAKSTYDFRHVPGSWDVVMHHGCAYAQAISNFVLFVGSKVNVSLSNGGFFQDSKGKILSLKDPQLMYWLLRYQVDLVGGKVEVQDRIQFTPGEIDAARKT